MYQTKTWLITHNNPTHDTHDYLEKWAKESEYVNGQLEKGENGTPHIQAFVHLKKKASLRAMKKHDPAAHFEPVKRDNGASAYCLKEDTRLDGPWEHGTKPIAR